MKQFVDIFLICSVLLFSSCGSYNKKDRKEIEDEIATLKKELPKELDGSGVAITNAEIVEDMIIVTYEVYSDSWEGSCLSKETASSDRNAARMISDFGEDSVAKIVSAGFGMKIVWKSREDKQTLFVIELQHDKLKDMLDKVKNGEIKPYSLLELTKMELDKMDLPSQLENGIWLTEAYIKGNNVYYVATFEYEVDKSNISEYDLNEVKNSLIEELREEPLVTNRKEEMIEENIHIIYIYKDSRGEECMTVNIAPDEIFNEDYDEEVMYKPYKPYTTHTGSWF